MKKFIIMLGLSFVTCAHASMDEGKENTESKRFFYITSYKSKKNNKSLDAFPGEILSQIMEYMPQKDQLHFMLMSKKYYLIGLMEVGLSGWEPSNRLYENLEYDPFQNVSATLKLAKKWNIDLKVTLKHYNTKDTKKLLPYLASVKDLYIDDAREYFFETSYFLARTLPNMINFKIRPFVKKTIGNKLLEKVAPERQIKRRVPKKEFYEMLANSENMSGLDTLRIGSPHRLEGLKILMNGDQLKPRHLVLKLFKFKDDLGSMLSSSKLAKTLEELTLEEGGYKNGEQVYPIFEDPQFINLKRLNFHNENTFYWREPGFVESIWKSSTFSKLETLEIKRCYVTWSIFGEILNSKTLKNLTHLYLICNSLFKQSEELLDEIFFEGLRKSSILPKLQTLDLSASCVGEEVFCRFLELDNFNSLKVLNLFGNDVLVNDQILTQISKTKSFGKLETLNLVPLYLGNDDSEITLDGIQGLVDSIYLPNLRFVETTLKRKGEEKMAVIHKFDISKMRKEKKTKEKEVDN